MRRNKNGFVFAIVQNICVTMPVEFSAEEAMGDSYLNCTGSSQRKAIRTNYGKVSDLPEAKIPKHKRHARKRFPGEQTRMNFSRRKSIYTLYMGAGEYLLRYAGRHKPMLPAGSAVLRQDRPNDIVRSTKTDAMTGEA